MCLGLSTLGFTFDTKLNFLCCRTRGWKRAKRISNIFLRCLFSSSFAWWFFLQIHWKRGKTIFFVSWSSTFTYVPVVWHRIMNFCAGRRQTFCRLETSIDSLWTLIQTEFKVELFFKTFQITHENLPWNDFIKNHSRIIFKALAAHYILLSYRVSLKDILSKAKHWVIEWKWCRVSFRKVLVSQARR